MRFCYLCRSPDCLNLQSHLRLTPHACTDALSASFIGDFLKAGGCDLGTGVGDISYEVTWDDDDIVVGEYIINCTKNGHVGPCPYSITASRICTGEQTHATCSPLSLHSPLCAPLSAWRPLAKSMLTGAVPNLVSTDQIDECVADDIANQVRMTEEAILAPADPNEALCRETWCASTLPELAFCTLVGHIFAICKQGLWTPVGY